VKESVAKVQREAFKALHDAFGPTWAGPSISRMFAVCIRAFIKTTSKTPSYCDLVTCCPFVGAFGSLVTMPPHIWRSLGSDQPKCQTLDLQAEKLLVVHKV
jgi:hypothetical protein